MCLPCCCQPPTDLTKWDEVKQRKWKDHVISQTGDPTNEHFEQWTQEDEQRVKGKGKEAKGKKSEETAATDKEPGDEKQSGGVKGKEGEDNTATDKEKGDKGAKQAGSFKGSEGIDLWKAYWVANIKEELAKMHNNYSIRKVGR